MHALRYGLGLLVWLGACTDGGTASGGEPGAVSAAPSQTQGAAGLTGGARSLAGTGGVTAGSAALGRPSSSVAGTVASGGVQSTAGGAAQQPANQGATACRAGTAGGGAGPQAGAACDAGGAAGFGGAAGSGHSAAAAAGGGAGAAAHDAQARAGVGGVAATGGGAGASGAGASTQGPRAGAGASGAQSPLYRVPLRVHVQQSRLTDAELTPIFAEVNAIWQQQAGICFDIEVTTSEDNRSDGFDFRYTAGRIPGASNANGLMQNAHSIWSIDHPQLNAAPHPVMHPTARTTAHELGHALGLAHQNPPPSDDCSRPCHCVERDDDCNDYLLRSGTKGFFISPPEVEIARQRAARTGKADPAANGCAAPAFMR